MEQSTFDAGDEIPPAPAKLCECGCGQPAPIATRTAPKRGQVKGQPLRFIRGHYKPPAGRTVPGSRRLAVEVGQRIGRSVVIDPEILIPEPSGKHPTRGVRLLCDCGNEYERRLFVLLKSKDASCGCKKGFVDRTGVRFGRLTAIRPIEREPDSGDDFFWWLCKCDCGNEVTVRGTALSCGHTKSCGCWRRKPGKGCLPGDAARNRVFRSYRKNAETRGISWDLTGADFDRLAAMDCFYCGAPPSMVGKPWSHGGGEWVYNGIDRVDNSKGYALDNVITACKICNHAKRDMSFDEFVAWIARLTEYHWFHPDVMPSRLLVR
jgi:hypothetical protein